MSDEDERRLERRVALGQEANRSLLKARARRGEPPCLVLSEFMTNEERALTDEDGYGWSAGGHMKALRCFLLPDVQILEEWEENQYQGTNLALLLVPESLVGYPVYVLWRDSFGSCSGCDSLEGENGYEYIEGTLMEGNTRQFWSIQAAVDYLRTSTDYAWEKAREGSEFLAQIEARA